MKGCGEAGCAGALTSVMNAIVDALSEYGVANIDMPATPERVWQAIQEAKAQPHDVTRLPERDARTGALAQRFPANLGGGD